MKLGISNRYALLFSAISFMLLLTVLLATGAVIWKSSETLKERMDEETVASFEALQHTTMYNVSDFLRRELFTPLYELNIEYIDRTIRDLYKGIPITSVRIADPSGKVLTDGTKENRSYGVVLSVDRKRLESTPVVIEEVAGGHRVTFRIGVEEYVAGFGEMIFSDEPLKRAIALQHRTMGQILSEFRGSVFGIAILATLFIGVLAVLMSLLFSRTLTLPLISLRDATVRLAHGDLDHRVEVRSHDELGELAAAFNKMVADLKMHMEEVRRTTEALRREVEERRGAERALMNMRERLMLAQRAGRVGVYDWDQITGNGVWTGMEELFGISSGEFSYQEWARLVHPEDLPELEALFAHAIAERLNHIEFEYRFVRPDGEVRWMHGTGRIFFDPDGTPTRMVGTKLDVSDTKARQQELTEAKEAAEAANVAKSEFLANMSHEMRTPIAGTLGMISLVLDMDIGQEERGLLEMAKRSGESLLRLMSDLLDFSRLEAGMLSFERQEFSLIDLVNSAVEVVSLQAREKGLELRWQLTGDVPDKVRGDQGRMRQVLVNLLGNSVKFTERGEVELLVSTFCDLASPQRQFLLFSVRDTGIGIAPENVERIFGKFIQVDPTSRRKHGGAGLGLALSRQIVAAMGGSLWAESFIGAGSTFRFSYPID
ncbi:ATP-binding protein [Geomonas sp. RF6]|uniref:ATP-binding protein n=1 Tax=Geomonas sp. RF6 TaxID=2897342 RepID=UPI001E612AE7|nr:ATP-binding protein [Geomonas sp. RF6]UFS69304.1 ATP-binding protein [Geomonas sp. RF6]